MNNKTATSLKKILRVGDILEWLNMLLARMKLGSTPITTYKHKGKTQMLEFM